MHGAEDRLVFDGVRHDRVTTFGPPCAPGAKNRDVVGLGSPRGKAHFVRPSANAVGQSLPSLVQGCAGLTPPAMQAGGVPESRPVEWRHGLHDLGPNRGRGGMIQVDRLRHGNNIRLFLARLLIPVLLAKRHSRSRYRASDRNFGAAEIVLFAEPFRSRRPTPTTDA